MYDNIVSREEVEKQARMYVEGKLAPCVIEALILIHCRPEPLPPTGSMRASALVLLKYELIKRKDTTLPGHWYQTTPRGAAHVDLLCRARFPVAEQVWKNPATDETLCSR